MGVTAPTEFGAPERSKKTIPAALQKNQRFLVTGKVDEGVFRLIGCISAVGIGTTLFLVAFNRESKMGIVNHQDTSPQPMPAAPASRPAVYAMAVSGGLVFQAR